MTEYVEDFDEDEDDYDIYDEIDELKDQLAEQEELAEINHAIRSVEQAYGGNLTNDQVQALGEAIDNGYGAEEAFTELGFDRNQSFDADFVETVEHLQEQHGRQLANSEVQKLYDASVYEGDARHVAPDALRDLTNKQDRISLANERIAEKDPPAEAPEVIAPLAEDATGKDRAAFIDARMAGAEVDTDTSYEIGEE